MRSRASQAVDDVTSESRDNHRRCVTPLDRPNTMQDAAYQPTHNDSQRRQTFGLRGLRRPGSLERSGDSV